MSSELTVQEAALAWAQGKNVEASEKSTCRWVPISQVGVRIAGNYRPDVFDWPERYLFRLAPEPTSKRYRPWTPEEVPVGALVRTARVGKPYRWLIVGSCTDGITTCGGGSCVSKSSEFFMECCEHSTDNGKTWLPCGVEVEV